MIKNFTAAFSIVAGATLIQTLLFRAGLDFAGYVSFIDFQSGNGMVIVSVEKHLFGNYYGAFLTYFVIVAIPLTKARHSKSSSTMCLLVCLTYFTVFTPPFIHIVAQSGGKDECADYFSIFVLTGCETRV